MRLTPFELLRSYLGTVILVLALCFQMLPFMFLLVVMAHTLGVSGREWLVFIPVFFFVMVFASCWLASKRTPRAPAWPPPTPKVRRTATKPLRDHEVLMKTRAERYRDLKNILGERWR